jgi:chemotaxis protein CheX
MKTEYIDAIIRAASGVLEEVLTTEISHKTRVLQTDPVPLHRTCVICGLSGPIEGYILLSMPREVVLSIASIITDEAVQDLDDLCQAAIVGLMNTITEEALQALRRTGGIAEAAPAALFWGQGLRLSCAEMETVVIPLQMSLGTVELTVALRESDAED